jgi:RsiW-degrading membrane proteinase PrsW (M82 family)
MQPMSVFLALSSGLLPIMIWLWFWLREDRAHPEPRHMILLAFMVGMLCVPLVIPLQHVVRLYFSGPMMLFLWAAIEELMKYGLAYVTVLRSHWVDEPLDFVLYMVVVALGFAAAENSLFLLNPIVKEAYQSWFTLGHMRFVGATLLHTLASGVIGASLALSFFKEKVVKFEYAAFGVILAIALHTAFNVIILKLAAVGTIPTMMAVWLGIACLLALCEYIKHRVRKIYG